MHNTEIIKALVQDYYDIQDVRIRSNNRVRAFEQAVSEQEHARIKEMTASSMRKIENNIKKEIKEQLKDVDIWTEWLEPVKGIGPVIGGGLIAYIEDIKKFGTMSKLWKYAGQAVDDDGRAQKRKKGEKLNYNPHLKVLLWKLGESFVKTNGKGRELYAESRAHYDEKWKTPDDCKSVGCKNKGKGKCMDGHRYAAAKRRTVKIFLGALYMKWRELEGLPEEQPYIMGRGMHSHIIKPDYFIEDVSQST